MLNSSKRNGKHFSAFVFFCFQDYSNSRMGVFTVLVISPAMIPKENKPLTLHQQIAVYPAYKVWLDRCIVCYINCVQIKLLNMP